MLASLFWLSCVIMKILSTMIHAKYYKYSVLDISEGRELGFRAVIAGFPKLYIVADNVQQLHDAVLPAITEEIMRLKKLINRTKLFV